MKKLSSADRSALIRLASELPKGSEDRRALLKMAARGENPLAARFADAFMRDYNNLGKSTYVGVKEMDYLGGFLFKLQQFFKGDSDRDPRRERYSYVKPDLWPTLIKAVKSMPYIGEPGQYGGVAWKPVLGVQRPSQLLVKRVNQRRPWDPLGRGLEPSRKDLEKMERERLEKMFPGGLFDPSKDRQLVQDLMAFGHFGIREVGALEEIKYLTEKEANSLRVLIRGLKREGLTDKDNFWAFVAFPKPNHFEFVESGPMPRRPAGGWAKKMDRFHLAGKKTRQLFETAEKIFRRHKASAKKRMQEAGDKGFVMPSWGTHGT